MSSLPKRESGQALLLVLLGMAAVLVTALSVVARSVTDISLTTKDEEAKRAFSAAEAGIENLLIGSGTSGTIGSSVWNGNITSLSTSDTYEIPYLLKSGESVTVWFVAHDSTGSFFECPISTSCYKKSPTQFEACWGDAGSTESTALEVSVFYDTTLGSLGPSPDFGSIAVGRKAYGGSTSLNGFATAKSASTAGSKCSSYLFATGPENLSNVFGVPSSCTSTGGCLLFARLRLLYNLAPQKLLVYMHGDLLPSQGKKISSLGQSGDAQRKVEIIQTYKEPLPIFDSVAFSGSGNIGR